MRRVETSGTWIPGWTCVWVWFSASVSFVCVTGGFPCICALYLHFDVVLQLGIQEVQCDGFLEFWILRKKRMIFQSELWHHYKSAGHKNQMQRDRCEQNKEGPFTLGLLVRLGVYYVITVFHITPSEACWADKVKCYKVQRTILQLLFRDGFLLWQSATEGEKKSPPHLTAIE